MTVIWNFFETGITCFYPNTTSCTLPVQHPYNLISFTLSDTTSTGFADYRNSVATVTDPGFAFSIHGSTVVQAPDFVPHYFFGVPSLTVFHLAWDEVDGQLLSVSVKFNDTATSVADQGGFGLTGGGIGADGSFGGCGATQCIVTGYWADDFIPAANVPEPSSLALLLGSVLLLTASRTARRRAQPAARFAHCQKESATGCALRALPEGERNGIR